MLTPRNLTLQTALARHGRYVTRAEAEQMLILWCFNVTLPARETFILSEFFRHEQRA